MVKKKLAQQGKSHIEEVKNYTAIFLYIKSTQCMENLGKYNIQLHHHIIMTNNHESHSHQHASPTVFFLTFECVVTNTHDR